jgi:amino-acid N-acetyltransferase
VLRAGVLQLITMPITDTIRKATPDDREQVHDLLKRASLPLGGIPDSLDGFIVAEDGGRIIGAGGVEDCGAEGLLRSIAVDQSARSRGTGKRIVEQLIDDARSEGRQSLYLLTTTAEDYFPPFGFTRVDRSTVPDSVRATDEFSTICSKSAIVMKLDLSDKSRMPAE